MRILRVPVPQSSYQNDNQQRCPLFPDVGVRHIVYLYSSVPAWLSAGGEKRAGRHHPSRACGTISGKPGYIGGKRISRQQKSNKEPV